MSYGKLMERILTIRNDSAYDLYRSLLNIAETRMTNMKLNLGTVAVLGDASASMQVAVNTSNIIASVLSNLCEAELRLFRGKDEQIQAPKSAYDVIEMSKKHLASGFTAPASSLWHYYENKKVIDTFIIVTDEEENTTNLGGWNSYNNQPTKGYMFAPLYKKYLEEINNSAKLIFVSFTKPGIDGYMIKEFKKLIPQYAEGIHVFKMDINSG